MKIYISGPMTEIKNFNFPAFELAEKTVRGLVEGAIPINPTKLPGNEQKNRPYEFYMKNDLKALLDCDGIYMLIGWGRSRGAKLEHKIAEALNLRFYYQNYEMKKQENT